MARPPMTKAEEGQPGFVGVRRNRLKSRALDAIRNDEIFPYWAETKLGPKPRETLERWGLAEFKNRGTFKALGDKNTIIILARLTPDGIKVRDDYHRGRAERADKHDR